MRKRKKKHTGMKVVWSLVAVLAVALSVLLFQEEIVGKAKEGVAGLAMEQLVEYAEQLPELSDVPVKEIYDSMEEKDKQTVKKLLADSITLDTVNDVKTYVEEKDIQGLKQYVEKNLSPEDKTAASELYEKYKNRILPLQ